jgi:hypothetical protein
LHGTRFSSFLRVLCALLFKNLGVLHNFESLVARRKNFVRRCRRWTQMIVQARSGRTCPFTSPSSAQICAICGHFHSNGGKSSCFCEDVKFRPKATSCLRPVELKTAKAAKSAKALSIALQLCCRRRTRNLGRRWHGSILFFVPAGGLGELGGSSLPLESFHVSPVSPW